MSPVPTVFHPRPEYNEVVIFVKNESQRTLVSAMFRGDTRAVLRYFAEHRNSEYSNSYFPLWYFIVEVSVAYGLSEVLSAFIEENPWVRSSRSFGAAFSNSFDLVCRSRDYMRDIYGIYSIDRKGEVSGIVRHNPAGMIRVFVMAVSMGMVSYSFYFPKYLVRVIKLCQGSPEFLVDEFPANFSRDFLLTLFKALSQHKGTVRVRMAIIRRYRLDMQFVYNSSFTGNILTAGPRDNANLMFLMFLKGGARDIARYKAVHGNVYWASEFMETYFVFKDVPGLRLDHPAESGYRMLFNRASPFSYLTLFNHRRKRRLDSWLLAMVLRFLYQPADQRLTSD